MQANAPAKRRVLVSGGAGFIGSHMVDRLVSAGYFVRVLDNLSTGSLDNIQGHIDDGKIEFVQGDIRDAKTIDQCLCGVDVVVHFAALVSVPLSVEHPELTYDINVSGTQNLLQGSLKASVKRFIFISSCAVYGDPDVLPVTEETRSNPISPYAESKLTAENLCLSFCGKGQLQTVILRFFNVYGPRQKMNDYSGVITRFIERSTKGLPLIIYGDGTQTRDFVNVSDVTAAVLLAIQKESVIGEVFNIGSGERTSIEDLAKMIIDITDPNLHIIKEKVRVGDIKDSYADISKANRLLGYLPQIHLKKGLKELST
jgi:UDP-glucose 4-epimerase